MWGSSGTLDEAKATSVKRLPGICGHRRSARILVLAVVLIALSVGYLIRHRAFLASLRGYGVAERDSFAEQIFPLLSRAQITQLGTAHREGHRPRGSYTLTDQPKPADTIRIGVFGCSFVFGAEAGPGQDFPSHLQKLYEAGDHRRVEVLNFGVGAYGVQQSYLLWQYLAGRFELDSTVYSLYGFHRHRDTSFIMLNTIFAPVHARYVLHGEGLRLIQVKGDDRRDAARGYFRLIPRWGYLRFDAKTPPSIRALLPRGRELPSNPFYYQSDPDDECAELYGRIFADMAARSERFVVLLNDQNSEALVRSSSDVGLIDSVRTSSEKFTWDRSGLYRAPKNHPSALGYYILAKETHAVLAGGREALLPDVEIGDPAERIEPRAMGRGLSDYDSVHLSLGGLPAAVFVASAANRSVHPYSFKTSRTDSLLDVSGPRNPLFVALEDEIPGDDLRLKFNVDGVPEEVVIGRILFIGGRLIGCLEPSWNTTRGDGWVVEPRLDAGAIAVDLVSGREIADVRIEVGGLTILRGHDRQREGSKLHRISWRSAEGDLLETRGHPEQNADSIVSSGGGGFCITARKRGDGEESWCTRHWRLDSTVLTVASPGIPPIS